MSKSVYSLLLILTSLIIGGCDSAGDSLPSVTLIGVTVVGSVEGDEGPVADAEVSMSGQQGELRTKTDGQGAFSFFEVPDGSYSLSASSVVETQSLTPGSVSSAVEFSAETDLTVAGIPIEVAPLELTGAIAGRLKLAKADGSGTEADSTGIEVYLPGTSFAARTDASGDFLMLYIQPGTYSVRAEKEGYEPLDIGELAVGSALLSKIESATLAKKADSDGDGILDENDPDDDNDGFPDESDPYPYDPAKWLLPTYNWVDVVADYGYLCAIKDDGSVWCWGFTNQGEFYTSYNDRETCEGYDSTFYCVKFPKQVSTVDSANDVLVRDSIAVVVNNDTTLSYWASSSYYSWSGTDLSAAPLTWDSLDISRNHACGVKSDSSLWCSGYFQFGEYTLYNSYAQEITTFSDWNEVAIGTDHTCAIRNGGELWCWGSNVAGQLGQGEATGPDSCDYPFWGACAYYPQRVGDADDWVEIVANRNSTCGRRADGSIWCWGENEIGLIANDREALCDSGTRYCVTEPVWQGTLTGVVEMAMSYREGCALKSDGAVWCWGDRGVDTTGSRLQQIAVDGHHFSTITIGDGYGCGLDQDGSIWCWGWSLSGALGTGYSSDYLESPAIVLGGEED